MTIPGRMRAILLTGHGGTECLSLRTDVPVPVPGPGDVLVQVLAAAVNNTDINTRIGWYSKTVTGATDAVSDAGEGGAEDGGWTGAFTFPRIQGADACGRIVGVGEGVDPARIGERVLIDPILRGPDLGDIRYLGSEVDGAFADYLCVPAANACVVTSGYSDVELASFPCAYSTAENLLARLQVKAGERVLITGASGGVGSAAVQLAKRRGAHVTAQCGAEKAAALLALGADAVVDRGAAAMASLGTEQFDAAVDVVGGEGFGAILNALRRGGRYGVSGAIAGPIVPLDLRTLYLKDLTLFGCTVLEPEVFPNLISYIERGEIKACIAAVYPLEEIACAQEAFLTKRHVGKIVLAG